MNNRESHLDSLRGIAALIVVIHHYFAAFYPYSQFGSQGTYQQHASWESLAFCPPFGLFFSAHLAVCLFFILSGYVLSYNHLGASNNRKKIFALLIKRPFRLGGLVLFSVLVSYCIWYNGLYFNDVVSDITTSKPWFSSYWKGEVNFDMFLSDISIYMFGHGSTYNPPLWTINIELYGSLFVYVFLFIFGSAKLRLIALFFLLFMLKNSLFQGFVIGIILADIIKNHQYHYNPQLIRFFQILLIVLLVYFTSYPSYVQSDFLKSTLYSALPNDINFGVSWSMVAALLLFVFVSLSEQTKYYLGKPFLIFLGKISYGIYVIHFLVLGSISSWLFLKLYEYIGYDLSFLIVFISGLPIIISLAYLITKYIDNPSIKFANYVGNKTINFTNAEYTRKIKAYLKKHILSNYSDR